MQNFKKRKYILLSSILTTSALLTGCFDGGSSSSPPAPGSTSISLDTAQYAVNQQTSTQITVTNTGSATVENVSVSDLPDGVTATSCASIAAGASCTITVTAGRYITAGTSNIVVGGSNTSNTASASLTVKEGVPLEGPPGADVESMVTAGSYVYAGTNGGGVFRKSISGTSWESVSTGLVNQQVGALATDASGNVYAATLDGVYKFNGISWNLYTTTGLPSSFAITHIAVDSQGNIFAIANNLSADPITPALYELSSGGVSWSTVTVASNAIPSNLAGNNGHVALAVSNAGTAEIYQWNGSAFAQVSGYPFGLAITSALTVDASGNIYVVVDSGGTYAEVTYNGGWGAPVNANNVSPTAIIPGVAAGSFYYAGVNGSSDVYSVYSYPGSGSVLTPITTSAFSPGNSGTTFRVTSLALQNGNLYTGTSLSGIYEYSGSAWSLDNTGLNVGAVQSLLYNNGLYAGIGITPILGQSTPTLTYLYDGSSWSALGTLGSSSIVNGLVTFLQNGNVYAATDSTPSNGVSGLSAGPTWTGLANSVPANIATGFATQTDLVGDSTNLYERDDATGNVLFSTGAGFTALTLQTQQVNAIFPVASGLGFYAIGTNNNIYSFPGGSDGAATLVYSYPSPNPPTYKSVLASNISGNHVYLAYATSPISPPASLNVCDVTSANTCVDIATTAITSVLAVNNPVVLYQNPANGQIYLGTGNGLYHYQSGTQSWEQVMSGVQVTSLYANSNNGNLYVGTSSGAYLIYPSVI